MKRVFCAFLREQGGQTTVEFALLLSMAVFMVIGINTSFRVAIKKMWFGLTKEIVAACPGCPPPFDVK